MPGTIANVVEEVFRVYGAELRGRMDSQFQPRKLRPLLPSIRAFSASWISK